MEEIKQEHFVDIDDGALGTIQAMECEKAQT